MLEFKSPNGNIFLDKEFDDLKNGKFERLKISRMDLEKRILRKKTDRGTDIGWKLDPGVRLRPGDVFKNEDQKIVLEQLPEKVISVKIKTKNKPEVMFLLGHIVGNRHRPVSLQGDEILFPIQADSELEIFTKLFEGIIDHIEMTIKDQVFYPTSGGDLHEH